MTFGGNNLRKTLTMHGGHASPGALLGVVTAFTVVANLATALRLFVRLVIKRTAGIDDATISVAMVCYELTRRIKQMLTVQHRPCRLP